MCRFAYAGKRRNQGDKGREYMGETESENASGECMYVDPKGTLTSSRANIFDSLMKTAVIRLDVH